MHLTDEERRILDGAFGEPQRIALSVLAKLGDAYGADRMVEIASAHIVGSSYQIAGEAGIEIYGQLVEQGARVRVRTTCDPGSIDFARWRTFKTPENYAERQIKIEELLRRMGVIPTWTCTPYTTFNVPRFGEDLGWSESSAVVFANSVIGARTNRLAAHVDVCGALFGRGPPFGLHLPARRRGVALSDMAGPPPGARTVAQAFGGPPPAERIAIGRREIIVTIEQMSTDKGGAVDIVGLGCPHASIDQMQRYAALLQGRRVHTGTELWICANTVVEDMARKMGYVDTIEKAGAKLMVGTCHNDCPLGAWNFRRLVTDSGKFAYYTPTTVGTECVFTSTEACIEAALTGQVIRS